MQQAKEQSPVIQRDVDLAPLCRFGVGGKADYFCVVTDKQELVEAVRTARAQDLRTFFYSGGSNIFFDDAGFRGMVIRFVDGGYSIDPERRSVTASAGLDLPTLVREVGQAGYGGLEFLGNIPGSVGGAVVGNAGCYGKELASLLISAEIVFADSLASRIVGPEYFEFSYRHSRLKYDPNQVVVNAALQLEVREATAVLSEVDDELALRLGKHPHEAQCAGSFFKNPGREFPAWKAITDAGMAGAHHGGAALSSMHANFLVNNGGATSGDIISLVREIQTAVQSKLDLELVPEVRYVSPTGIQEISPD
jgi:UDP-N-acetylmuramate dehydrogenase